ncbi:MAG: hypothetical protein J6386_00785 [Candidatus Synoicihabitans palmerolidicus]|nr:hypothetical protein [Candidatus Synoicihabitans palmerolidicus]
MIQGHVASQRAVTVGLSNGIATEVKIGLETGETVVIYPGDRISDGSRVKPITE